MSSSSRKWILCSVVLAIVLMLGSPAWGKRGNKDKKDQRKDESEEIMVAVLPSFGLAGNLSEDSQKTFNTWAGDLVPKEIAGAAVPIAVAQSDGKADPKDLEGLPDTSGGRTAALLSPVCERLGADGALVFWLEKGRDDSFQMVSLLYLPERIQLESFVVSVNFEREPVEIEEGKLLPPDFESALRATLQRNLDRVIVPEQPPTDLAAETKPEGAEEGSKEDPEEEPAIDLAPASGGGDGALREDEKWRPERSSPRKTMRLGVIDFSRDFTQPESDIRKTFSETPLVYDFPGRTREALTETTGHTVVAVERSPLSYRQIAAPANTLAGEDPKAKEKSLARICKREGVDGLVFGHLRQRDGPGSDGMDLFLRLFLKDDMRTYTASSVWPAGRPEAEVSDVMSGLVRDVVQQTGGAPPPRPRDSQPAQLVADGDDLTYTIRGGDTLFSISKKCYPGSRGEAIKPLQLVNGIKDEKHIEKGARLRIPKHLGEYERRDSACQ